MLFQAGGLRSAEAFLGYMPGVNSGAEMSINGSGGRGREVMIDGASLTIGFQYAFTPQGAPPGSRKPLIVRAFKGASSDCDLFPIMTLQCTSTHTQDPTDVAAIGRSLRSSIIERVRLFRAAAA